MGTGELLGKNYQKIYFNSFLRVLGGDLEPFR